MSDDYIFCPGCDKRLKRGTTKPERYRKHGDCDFSQTIVREDDECKPSTPATTAPSPTASSAESPPDDATESATPATSPTPSSPASPEPSVDASTSADASPALPGVTSYVAGMSEAMDAMVEQVKDEVTRLHSASGRTRTHFTQPTPPDYERPTLFSQPVAWDADAPPTSVSTPITPPASFSQPAGRRSEQPQVEMGADAASIAARLKELFYSYDNRRSADNRSAQATMGPSEMGTPCDRRLALSLMRMPPVNPGGDGWAAFVGTCIHAGLEEMFLWASGNTGRFAVEQRLEFGSVFVPKGTADLIDRVLLMVLDHKCQGRWSRNKLRTSGPSPTYRIQAHVYAYGARLRGEKIEKIAIVSWPRDEASLDDLYVHVEDYDPMIAKKAFERVEKIGREVEAKVDDMVIEYGVNEESEREMLPVKARVANEYTVADDCRFCPFYLPNARNPLDGCNGKR